MLDVNNNILVENKCLTLTITDNGVGFSGSKKNKTGAPIESYGIGLRNLTERIEYHCGQLNVCTSREGTSIIAIIPSHVFAYYVKNSQKDNWHNTKTTNASNPAN